MQNLNTARGIHESQDLDPYGNFRDGSLNPLPIKK